MSRDLSNESSHSVPVAQNIATAESTARRRPRFQFSLRESLIATVAICAVVALFVKNRPYSPTAFVLGLNEKALLTQCCEKLGLTLDVGSTGQSTLNDNAGGYVRETSLSIRNPEIDQFRSTIMPAFQSRIEQLLEESGCAIHGRSQGGNTDMKELHEFGFRYQRGVARGAVRVYSLEQSSGEIRLLILVDES